MSEKLLDYVKKVNEDADFRAQHEADAAEAAKSFGLEGEDLKMVSEGDEEGIKAKIKGLPTAEQYFTFHSPE